MLTGSLAAASYASPRATQDIDVVVELTPERLEAVIRGLLDAGFYVSRDAAHAARETGGQFNAIDPEQGWKVDLIIRRDRPFSVEEFSRRRRASLLGVELSVATLEDLIIAKLEWAALGDSDLQRRDAAQLLEARADDPVDESYIRSWVERLGLEDEWQAVMRRLGRE